MRLPTWMLHLLSWAIAARSEFPMDQECPDDCDCHYFRVNYVTDCSESNFTEIPYEEISLNVFILDMNGNEITDVEPFPEDIKIRRLQLAENKLSKITGNMFAGLKYLLEIDLSGNFITSVDPDSFRDSHGLTSVELQNNPLSPLTSGSFLDCKSLLYLDISHCNLTHLVGEFFTGTPVLSYLDLSWNSLTELDEDVFRPLPILEELKLSHCDLTHLSGNLLTNQYHLKTLDLSGNRLSTVDWFAAIGKLLRLENLDLRQAGIRTLPANAFANNTFLRHVTLADNDLSGSEIGNVLGENLGNLHMLDLSNCSLAGPLAEDTFANVTNLKILNLSGNRLSSRDLSAALVPLDRLTGLTLRNCSLTRLPKDTFENLSHLRELDISWNPLNKVFEELLDSLSNLEYLNMGYSNLSHLSNDTFSKTKNLKLLILSGNKLGELETGLFKNLRHLESLEIENCGLERAIDEEVFYNKTYGDLLELKMSNNPLRVEGGSLIPEQLSRLTVLDLSKCNLSYLPDESFVHARYIKRLNLSGNKLGTEFMSRAKFLQPLTRLEYLDLSGNSLTVLPLSVVPDAEVLQDVRLTNNPWICNCTLAEWWNWALDKGDIAHLIGSTLTVEDIFKKGTKRKKGLLCVVDTRSAPPIRKTSRKPPGGNIRTWARYLKESNCQIKKITTEQKWELRQFFPEPILPDPQPASLTSSGVDVLSAVAFRHFLGLAFAAVVVVGA